LLDPEHPMLSVRRQCELIGLNRSTVYYEPAPERAANLALMRLIDEQYTTCPFYGSRRIAAWLRTQGHEVNRKRVAAPIAAHGPGSHLPEAELVGRACP